jgi:hypothetical protein
MPSVPRGAWTTPGGAYAAPVEVVVHASRDKIHIAADPISTKDGGSSWNKKRRVAVAHEDMIVLNGNRPIRGKAVFEADANCAAPLRVIAGRSYNRVRCGKEDIPTIVGHRGAALHVEQDVVPGIANLAGEQPERIHLRAIDETGKEEARIGCTQISPVPWASRPNTHWLTSQR